MNAIYDMNGKANPNQVGKDVGFVTVLYPDETNKAVAPNPVNDDSGAFNWNDAKNVCSGKNISLPDKEELLSISYNALLTNLNGLNYWSGNSQSNSKAWFVTVGHGVIKGRSITSSAITRCVKRF